PANAMLLDHVADLEAVDGKAGYAVVAGFVEAAGHQPARIVVGVLEVERPGEVAPAIERLKILLRQGGAGDVVVGTTGEHGFEFGLLGGGEHAAELEDDAILQATGEPGDEIDGGLAADQAKVADHPRRAAAPGAPWRRRAGGRGVELVLQQEPGAGILLHRREVVAMEPGRG